MENEIEKLKAENEKLKEMNAFKSDLISITVHELRTSLSATKWIFKMFLDNDLGELTDEQREFMTKGFESNERMISLVSEILSINHTEDTELKYDFEKTNLIAMIENVLFEFTSETYKRGIEVIFIKPETPISEVSVDRDMFRIVLLNLIENAIKYNNKGERVFVALREKEKTVELSVKDTGIGISEEDQKKIFDKFFRAPNAQQKESIGSGLGLFTTKNIVEKHNGKIWFESKEGTGTTFFVSVPKTL